MTRRKSWRPFRRHHEQDIAFTVDILGEAVVSETEAAQCAQRYLDLMEVLGGKQPDGRASAGATVSPQRPVPVLDLSVKLSAPSSQIHPANPDTALAVICRQARGPCLRRAKELGALINLDMESYRSRT